MQTTLQRGVTVKHFINISKIPVVSAVFTVITCITFTIGDKLDAESTLPADLHPNHVTFTMSYSFGVAIFAAIMEAACGGFITFELLTTKNMIPR